VQHLAGVWELRFRQQGALGGIDGHHKVGAGVTVRNRIHVELVDLLLMAMERGQRSGTPVADNVRIETIEHEQSP
jgi:hypothetical protein